MTWFEFSAVAKALQANRLHDFNVMRHGASLNLMAHVDKKHRKQIMPNKLFPLEIDKLHVKDSIDEAEARYLVQQLTRRLINLEEVN